ncbi:MAG: hypothetical protein AAFN13_14425, partial [Bacteroidota bacterium]
MPVLEKTIPDELRFLTEVGDNIKIRQDDATLAIPDVRIQLTYTSDLRTYVELGDQEATVYLNARFIDTVCDYVSSLKLEDLRASRARAFIATYNIGLDVALGYESSPLAAGMLCDYLVSRTTAEFEIPHVTDEAFDLKP